MIGFGQLPCELLTPSAAVPQDNYIKYTVEGYIALCLKISTPISYHCCFIGFFIVWCRCMVILWFEEEEISFNGKKSAM